ncbi:MAG TPA: hypothetical protein VJB89_00600 [Candidatus Nanoarchaeia archaeon]|nr:hypothetical protein [Candidatus Nanoarchaeia archaeon]
MIRNGLYAMCLGVLLSCCSNDSLSTRVFSKVGTDRGEIRMNYVDNNCMVHYESGPMIVGLGIRNIPKSLCDVFYNAIKRDIEKGEIPSFNPMLEKKNSLY